MYVIYGNMLQCNGKYIKSFTCVSIEKMGDIFEELFKANGMGNFKPQNRLHYLQNNS